MPGVRITQEQRGLPGRRYGAFAGRPLGATTHPVVRLTQQGAWAVPLARYAIGAFAGKAVAAVVTRNPAWSLRRGRRR